MPTSG